MYLIFPHNILWGSFFFFYLQSVDKGRRYNKVVKFVLSHISILNLSLYIRTVLCLNSGESIFIVNSVNIHVNDFLAPQVMSIKTWVISNFFQYLRITDFSQSICMHLEATIILFHLWEPTWVRVYVILKLYNFFNM